MIEKDVINQALDILYLVGKEYSLEKELRDKGFPVWVPSYTTEKLIFQDCLLQIKYEEEEHHIGILSIRVFHKPSSDYIEVFKVRISGWKYQLEPDLLFVFKNRGYVWTPLLENIKNSPEYIKAKIEHFSILANY